MGSADTLHLTGMVCALALAITALATDGSLREAQLPIMITSAWMAAMTITLPMTVNR